MKRIIFCISVILLMVSCEHTHHDTVHITSDTIAVKNLTSQKNRILFCSDIKDTVAVVKEYQKYGKYLDYFDN